MKQYDIGPLVRAGTLLGIGLGGFVDGIVFHQILQLHNMLTAKYPKTGVDAATALVHVEVNMFWDGLFHAFTWAMVAAGLALLWRAFLRGTLAPSTRAFVGAMALGWGLFNLVEGLIDHAILKVHHVVEAGNHPLWDGVFLASGAILIAVGWTLIRSGRATLPTVQEP